MKAGSAFSSGWRRSFLPALLGAFVLTGCVVLLRAQNPTLTKGSPSPQPKITWSDSQIEVTLSLGETLQMQTWLTSSVGVQDVIVEPVPGLGRFVAVTPSSLATVEAGKHVPVQLSFAVPNATALGTYSGTIHARIGAQTLPQTLKVTVNVWQSFSSPTFLNGLRFDYPPNWTLWPASQASGEITISNVAPGSQLNPASMAGVCKLTIARLSKPSGLGLLAWIESDPDSSISSTPVPVTFGGLSGFRRITSEMTEVENVFLPLSDTSVLSAELICGGDMQQTGEAAFNSILSTLAIH